MPQLVKRDQNAQCNGKGKQGEKHEIPGETGLIALQGAQALSRQSSVAMPRVCASSARTRSEEHTSELQSLMRISYAVFCLKKKNNNKNIQTQPKTTNQYTI